MSFSSTALRDTVAPLRVSDKARAFQLWNLILKIFTATPPANQEFYKIFGTCLCCFASKIRFSSLFHS